jgi:hypothetical protein
MIATLTTSAALTPARHVQASIAEIFAPQTPPPAPD